MAEDSARWFAKPGIWFWLAIVLGLALRLYLAVFTEGTLDVAIWERHARDVLRDGLITYYQSDDSANHPPFITEVEALLLRCSDASGIPFRILLRAPFVLVDAGNALLLLLLLPVNRWRFVLVALYCLNPLAPILSAYHGNTDCAVAFFIMLCAWLLSRERIIAAAICLGLSFWIKLPAVIALPAFLFFIRGWNRRLMFLSVTAVSALIGYLPALILDAPVIWKNVFAYHGLRLASGTNEPIWGIRILLFSVIAAPAKWPGFLQAPVLFLLGYGSWIGIALFALLSWLRRNMQSVAELCATIAAGYVIVYSLTDQWAFQYFAWSLPLWFFLRPWFSLPGLALVGGFIYSLYWFLCGNPWLLGQWDFFGRGAWPPVVTCFRDLSTLFFFGAACVFLLTALLAEFKRRGRGSPIRP